MQRPDAPARAAWLCASLLLAASLPGGPNAPRVCDLPGETAHHAGHTAAVACSQKHRSGHEVRGPARMLFGMRIDLNGADVGTLEVLPGIGPSRASAIVQTRSMRIFSSVEDLLRVPGIGPRRLAALRPHVTLESVGACTPERDANHLQSSKGR
jgi:competence protein ComEA